MKTQRENRGIALLFNTGAIWGFVDNATHRWLHPQEMTR